MKKHISKANMFLLLMILITTVSSYADEYNQLAYSSQFEKVKLISQGRLINVVDFTVPHKYTVFMFTANWCAPCGPLKEKLSELANRVDTMALRELDIINLENPLVKYYNLPAIPYFLVYGPEGNFVERGPMLSKEVLKKIASQNE
ncbi:MAG: thioredoxin family protein [Thermodesulfobacteriota bacterium]